MLLRQEDHTTSACAPVTQKCAGITGTDKKIQLPFSPRCLARGVLQAVVYFKVRQRKIEKLVFSDHYVTMKWNLFPKSQNFGVKKYHMAPLYLET